MEPVTFVVDRTRDFQEIQRGVSSKRVLRNGVLISTPPEPGEESHLRLIEIIILKRLQREAFSDLMKLRDRQDKMERVLSFYKSSKGSPFQEVSTHMKGIVDLVGALLFVDNTQQACDALNKAGRRIGINTKVHFEAAGLPPFGPSLFSEWRDCAGGLMFKGLKFGASSAVLFSKLAPLTDSTAGRCSWSTFVQLTYQTYNEMRCAVSGLWQMPSRTGQVIQLGPLSIPVGFPKRRLPFLDAQGQPPPSSVTSRAIDHQSASSQALMVELSFDESAKLGAWIELQSGLRHWGISLSDTPEDEVGWGLLVSRMVEGQSRRSHFEGFLNYNMGRRFCLQPGLLYLMDGSTQTPAFFFRTNWIIRLLMAKPISIEVWNPSGKYRVVSTKSMPGTRWINLLTAQDCRVEICTEKKTILSVEDILALIGDRCDGVIGQLTEDWGEVLFSALKRAGGTAFSNMAVGYNNVDVSAANKYGVAVGNTPVILTETTAELAAALSLAAARRIVEADQFMRAGNLLKGQTVGVIGAGRIGSAYARMMVPMILSNHVSVINQKQLRLEKFVTAYGQFLKANGEQPVTWKRAATMVDVLREADVISLHPILDKTTYHLINKDSLAIMKKEAILVNASRGPVIDEAALVEHLKANPMFRVGLDVFEDEPFMKPGLAEQKNAVIVPHIASASKWTREGMATLAALNVLGKIKGYPIWSDPNRVDVFLDEKSPPPSACPSIVNAKHLGLTTSKL
ncbi:hypothetical protein J5N97_022801 [Dioscorea zingiberensis]|uniref:Glycerate dehydrogenase n=1 Tax=Dioscorea zingiberensis TaxID=325984 RepID=A0A9D5CBK7_9LILI|nr:hypothetical protein J5N97_022801 [Dioscorea zingiberensis]